MKNKKYHTVRKVPNSNRNKNMDIYFSAHGTFLE